MRILYLDLDSLRADHLGCYGYHRETSPAIDALARNGIVFRNCYVSDAPCHPSRTALATGRFGIHNGVVNHGGRAAEPFNLGLARPFNVAPSYRSLFHACQQAGYRTTSISSFPQRHAAWWFVSGLREWINPGKNGLENADEVNALALPWLEQNATADDWFLHVNYWDPHTPYTAPETFGNPFESSRPPSWLEDALLNEQWRGSGTHSARDRMKYWYGERRPYPRMPDAIASHDDWKSWIDGYDAGIRFADDHIRQIIDLLERKGVIDDTVIIVSADHGENQGELNIYGDHQTADQPTLNVPFVVSGPIVEAKGIVQHGLFYQIDLMATVLNAVGVSIPEMWDAQPFPSCLADPMASGRESLVLSQMAWTCQRSVRFDRWMLIRTYHASFLDVPDLMLFDVVSDPHQQQDLAPDRRGVVLDGIGRLEQWHSSMMATSPADPPVDPLQTVLREGGPFHFRDEAQRYVSYLSATGREEHAARIASLLEAHPVPGPR
jgi:choline-sulfatase